MYGPQPLQAMADGGAYVGEYQQSPSTQSALEVLDQAALENFYTQRSGEPFWLNRNRLNKQAAVMIQAIQNSWSHGLNPETYHWSRIAGLMGPKVKAGKKIPLEKDSLMNFELMLTDSFVRYVRDQSGMRVKASALGLEASHWRQRPDVASVLALLNSEGDFEKLLRSVEPQGATYKALQAELLTLTKKWQEDPAAQVEPIRMAKPLSPGKSHAEVPKLRQRLGLPEIQEKDNRLIYDTALVEAVKQFQAEKGLKSDGVIGAKTLFILNQNLKDKIRQIIVNLERLRWMPTEDTSKVIMVNLPSATLWALENGQVKIEMPVIVGRPKRATLSFRTEVTGVRFNPDWTVPPTIQKEDILPKLIDDPGYLVDKGMEIYQGYGQEAQTLDPMATDWAAMTPEEYRSLRLVQIPGSHNPLGRIRVLMPNRHNIYLHDTNDRKLFGRSDRAQSSGCIRLQEPEKLASFILSNREGWSEEKLRANIKSKKTRDIMIPQTIPVYLLYYTAWIGPQGQVVFGEDIYSHDKKLLQALEKNNGIYIPNNSNSLVVKIAD
ncbi:MAG: L,D-transpeptidase family protein [Alphaproteobacteria bacterium]|nr:L,D-transpeptidase family protein [Alphaproteobacteria bacterium]QQS56190.1 MAG: L,D-transpeptidase family protein [Alphaproteobacteria bacterium]